jgi:hypothetical protein
MNKGRQVQDAVEEAINFVVSKQEDHSGKTCTIFLIYVLFDFSVMKEK